MTKEAQYEFIRETELALRVVQSRGDSANNTAKVHAAIGVRLWIEEHFDVAHVLGMRAPQYAQVRS